MSVFFKKIGQGLARTFNFSFKTMGTAAAWRLFDSIVLPKLLKWLVGPGKELFKDSLMTILKRVFALLPVKWNPFLLDYAKKAVEKIDLLYPDEQKIKEIYKLIQSGTISKETLGKWVEMSFEELKVTGWAELKKHIPKELLDVFNKIRFSEAITEAKMIAKEDGAVIPARYISAKITQAHSHIKRKKETVDTIEKLREKHNI